MSFNILYVEDNNVDWEGVLGAVKAYNEKAKGEKLIVERAGHPNELPDKLELRFDVILADVFFEKPKVDRLDAVIDHVNAWRNKEGRGRSLPIIAYTSVGPSALKRCLERREHLYDIWDKNTASHEYVAWRLLALANEVSRIRPDSYLQRLVSEIEPGARWHRNVKDMVRRYDSGWTETDQIERAGVAIRDIAHSIGAMTECKTLWEATIAWEATSRALSKHVRGHARHVINVFWLGYYLLHHEFLSAWFVEAWRRIMLKRSGMEALAEVNPLEALSDSWFLCSLFHDSANCVQRVGQLWHMQARLLGAFDIDALYRQGDGDWLSGLRPLVDNLVSGFDSPLRDGIGRIVRDSFEAGEPDHGVVAGAQFLRKIKLGAQGCCAREAARAAAVHNLFPDLYEEEARSITWDSEPLVCLLLLCDQLQAWDRERGDEALMDSDDPQRAELSRLEVTGPDEPGVSLCIDYILPAHVSRSPVLYERVQDRLTGILHNHPIKALERIGGKWPFSFSTRFSLSGSMLDTKLELQKGVKKV